LNRTLRLVVTEGGSSHLWETRWTLGYREHILLVQQHTGTHNRPCRSGNRLQKFRWTAREGGQTSGFAVCGDAVCWCRC